MELTTSFSFVFVSKQGLSTDVLLHGNQQVYIFIYIFCFWVWNLVGLDLSPFDGYIGSVSKLEPKTMDINFDLMIIDNALENVDFSADSLYLAFTLNLLIS